MKMKQSVTEDERQHVSTPTRLSHNTKPTTRSIKLLLPINSHSEELIILLKQVGHIINTLKLGRNINITSSPFIMTTAGCTTPLRALNIK